MVRINPPPPSRDSNPTFFTLPSDCRLLRIYTPGGQWANTPISFRRRNGPTERFDHHLGPGDDGRGIHYSALTLAGCIVEVFGDDGFLVCGERRLGSMITTRSLKLLDLRADGAWRAGAVAAICACSNREDSQQWSRYFYDRYPDLDGLVYPNAYNGVSAFALYERAEGSLFVEHDLALKDPLLKTRLLAAAEELNLVFVPDL